MEKKDYPEFATLWSTTTEVCSGKTPNDHILMLVFESLRKYEMVDVRRALNAHIADPDAGRFAPKPADIIRKIDGDPDSRALQAWTAVEDAIRHIGPYATVSFHDQNIMACISDIGGWISLSRITEEELPFVRNEFVKRYRGYLSRPPERTPKKLTGIIEHQNQMLGYPDKIPEPVFIGGKKKIETLPAPAKKELPQNLAPTPDQKEKIKQFKELANKMRLVAKTGE